MCEKDGNIVQANVVDHIEPHKGNLTKFFGGPFQSLCYTHHDSTKQRMELYGVIIGGDESFYPPYPLSFIPMMSRIDWIPTLITSIITP